MKERISAHREAWAHTWERRTKLLEEINRYHIATPYNHLHLLLPPSIHSHHITVTFFSLNSNHLVTSSGFWLDYKEGGYLFIHHNFLPDLFVFGCQLLTGKAADSLPNKGSHDGEGQQKDGYHSAMVPGREAGKSIVPRW